jgi:hypothetical protein
MEDAPTIPANALQIDFEREDFRRERTDTTTDPSIETMFSVVNSVLERLRVLTDAGHLKPMVPNETTWRVTYLDETGKELPEEPTKYRMVGRVAFKIQAVAFGESTWRDVAALAPNYAMPAWHRLLLDAVDALPDVGPTVVLAAAAIETRIETALDALAALSDLPTGLWSFINTRDQYWREPSVADQLDALLKALSGSSLKDQPKLWEAAKNLRDARNSLVHTGVAMIGTRPVERDDASKLVGFAGDVIRWIEALLPESERKPERTEPGTAVFTKRVS